MENAEKLMFWTNDDEKLHDAKEDLMLQMSNLDISVNGNDYFLINRQFLASVSVDME